MWPFAKKRSSGVQPDTSGNTLDTVLDLQRRIKSIELELEEQHDFLKRLAGRRAKETANAEARRVPGGPAADVDLDVEPVPGAGLPARKLHLWQRAKSLKSGGSRDESA